MAIAEIDAGDALAMATRFDREWAYRGAQALLWKRTFTAHDVHDLYLPAPVLRPFDRRGLLRVDGDYAGANLHVFATQFAADRNGIRDLRFARNAVRSVTGDVLLFISDPVASRVGFTDLGLQTLIANGGLAVCARGYRVEQIRGSDRSGLHTAVAARAVRA